MLLLPVYKSVRLVLSAYCKKWPVASYAATDAQTDKGFEPVIKQD